MLQDRNDKIVVALKEIGGHDAKMKTMKQEFVAETAKRAWDDRHPFYMDYNSWTTNTGQRMMSRMAKKIRKRKADWEESCKSMSHASKLFIRMAKKR